AGSGARPAPHRGLAAPRRPVDGRDATGAGAGAARRPARHHRGAGAAPGPPRGRARRAPARGGGRQAARFPGPGDRARDQHDRLQGERRHDRTTGDRDERGAGKIPGAGREPRVRPFLLVLSSPSGGGKSTIARHLLNARDDLGYSVSATTRVPRNGETDGVDYHFLTAAEFDRRVEAGEFVEWAAYGGSKYGTLKVEVERVMDAGMHVV